MNLQSRNPGSMTMEESPFEIQETRSSSRLMSAIFFKFIRPCLAEFFATMFFVFVDVCSIGSANYAGFTHGFILFVLVAATAGVRTVMRYSSKGDDESCSDSSDTSCNKLCCKCIRPCIAELVATMLFVFTGVLSSCHTTSWFSAGFTHGLILFVLVAATLYVSGGHINPAVTLALTICRGLQPILAPLYVIAQLLGAIIGAALAKAVMTSEMYNNVAGGVHKIGHNIDPGQAILAEMIATSILVLAVLMVAFDERNKSVLGPLAIGLSVAGGIFAIGQISGASMNPARSFGPAVVKGYWKKHYVYWVGPVLGSIFSALLYSLVLGAPNKLWLPCHEPQN